MPPYPLPDPATLPEANRAAFENPSWGDLAKHTAALGPSYQPLTDLWMALYFNGFLPKRTLQIVLNRTSQLSGCTYELIGEKKPAEAEGLTGEHYDAIFGPLPSPLFTDAENAAAALVDELVEKVKADDAVFARATSLLGPDQTREVILVTSVYMFYARMCANLGIERH